MRELKNHRVAGKDTSTIWALDAPGQGGACHAYRVWFGDALESPSALEIYFQNGPIQEVGVNGVQQEHLLAIVEDRLACFQAGPFANTYNQEALACVRDALAALKRRTADRIARNVEGFNIA